MTIKRTKTATMQRQPKQIVEYRPTCNHRTTIEWSYYCDIMMKR